MANQQEPKNAPEGTFGAGGADAALIKDPGILEFKRRASPPQLPNGDGPPRKWEPPKSESTPANRKQNDKQGNPEAR